MRTHPWMILICLSINLSVAKSVCATESRLVEKEGAVYIHLEGTNEGDLIEAIEGADLDQGDQVVTGSSGMARFVIDGDSIVELGANSDFTIEKADDSGFRFHLAAGEIFAKIKSLLEKKQTMSIRTPVAVAAVRGTELVVDFDPESDQSHMAVFDEGRMSVESFSTGEKADLDVGQEVTVVRGLGRLKPSRLHRFEGRRDHLVRLRERREFFRRQWAPRTSAERQEFRMKFRQERRLQRQNQPQLKPAPQPSHRERPQNSRPVRSQSDPLQKRRR